MKNEHEYSDILRELSNDNIANVKATFQLHFNQYDVFYVVDTYDIIEYCFPFIFNTGFNFNSHRAVINFLSYQLFFFEAINKPIIMDEYRVEIVSFWFRLKKKIDEYSNYDNLKADLTKKYRELTKKEDKIDFIQNNVGLLLSLAFGTISKTPIERYNQLIKTAVQHEDVEIADKGDQNFIEDIFIATKPDFEKVNRHFEHFTELEKYALYGRSEEEKFRYLENSYRDIQVFDRVIGINRKVESAKREGKLKGNYAFFYFSSATRKSERIESLYVEEMVTYDNITNKSFVRSNLETYFYLLLSIGDDENARQQIISLIEKLEFVSQTYADKAKRIEEYKKLVIPVNLPVADSLKQDRFENLILKYQAINKYQKRINKAISKLRITDDDHDLLYEFETVLDEASRKEPQQILKQVEESLEEYTDNLGFTSDMLDDIAFLQTGKKNYKLRHSKGTDFIWNLPHSFPILLFYKKKYIDPVIELFQRIAIPNESQNKTLKNFLSPSKLTLLGFSTPEKKLFFLFIRYLFDDTKTTEQVIFDIDSLIHINRKANLKSEIDNNHLKLTYLPNLLFHQELVYLKSWLLRKLNRNEEAIRLINRELRGSQNPDPRLFQSRALCLKNKYYGEIDIQAPASLEKILRSALRDFVKCEHAYLQVIGTFENATLLRQSLLAISNSIADTYTKLFFLNRKKYKTKIPKARTRINQLKADIKQLGFNYLKFPVYSHTEIDIEYCEAYIAFDRHDIETADRKINEAKIRINILDNDRLLKDYGPLKKSKTNVKKLSKAVSSYAG